MLAYGGSVAFRSTVEHNAAGCGRSSVDVFNAGAQTANPLEVGGLVQEVGRDFKSASDQDADRFRQMRLQGL